MSACLLLSLGLWFIVNMSRRNSAVVSVPVVALSNIPGCAQRSYTEAEIVARCKASGFRLFRLQTIGRSAKPVFFSPDDFNAIGRGRYSISASSLNRYVEAVFGPGVEVEAFISPDVKFSFKPEYCRKLPIKPICYFSFSPQYMAAGDVQLNPDSVLVYGDAEMLDKMESVSTESFQHYDLHRNANGMASLNVPAGVRASISEVRYELPVTRFVSVEKEMQLKVRNLPDSIMLSLFPSSVYVTARIAFPIKSSFPGDMECYVDYNEFVTSRVGECIIKMTPGPEGLLDISADPQLCRCVDRVR